MSKITAIRNRQGRIKRVRIFLDDHPAINLVPEEAARQGLAVGQELSTERIKALARSDRHERCLNTAHRYLSYRPRSEAELRNRLRRHGFSDDTITTTLSRLRETGLVDDAAFASFWRENRESFSPRSQRLTRLELRRKGVADDIADRAVEEINDEDSAYRTAQLRAYRWAQSDYPIFRRRLGGYLKRRGFGYAVTNHTIERLWREMLGRETGPGCLQPTRIKNRK